MLAVCLIALSGCYTYAPARSTPMSQGAAVRAQLSAPMSFPLTQLTANDVVSIAGEVVRQSPDTLVLSAQSLRAQTGYEFLAAGETVTIPADRIAGLERRRISALRSAAVAGAGILAGALFIAVFDDGGGGSGPGRNPPTPQ